MSIEDISFKIKPEYNRNMIFDNENLALPNRNKDFSSSYTVGEAVNFCPSGVNDLCLLGMVCGIKFGVKTVSYDIWLIEGAFMENVQSALVFPLEDEDYDNAVLNEILEMRKIIKNKDGID